MQLQALTNTCSSMHLNDVNLSSLLNYDKSSFESWAFRNGLRKGSTKSIIYYTTAPIETRRKLNRTIGFKRIGGYTGRNSSTVSILLKTF